LSEDADQETVRLVWVADPTVTLPGTVGACVSPEAQADVDTDTDAFADRFPAASKASTANEYPVPQESPDAVKDVVVVVPTEVVSR